MLPITQSDSSDGNEMDGDQRSLLHTLLQKLQFISNPFECYAFSDCHLFDFCQCLLNLKARPLYLQYNIYNITIQIHRIGTFATKLQSKLYLF